MYSKIAFVVYDFSIIGGAERVSVNIANELSAYYDVTIVSLTGKCVHPSYIINDAVKIRFLNIKGDQLRKQIITAFFPLVSYLRKEKIAVALIEGTYCGIICSLSKLFVKTKLIFCDHGSLMSQYNEKKTRTIRKIASSLCDHTVVLTERSRKDYIQFFKMKQGKITCIYNWLNEERINPQRVYDVNSKTILSVGRFSAEKGYDLLIEVASIVLPQHPSWRWTIFGQGEVFNDIKMEVMKRKLEGQLLLAGEVNNLNDAYEHAAMLVLPSYREGMPLALLEAKCYKLPLVSFDIISGPREIIMDNQNGYLIPPYDVKEMARKINLLIDDKQLRETMSEHAYDNIEPFRKETILDTWINLIDELGG